MAGQRTEKPRIKPAKPKEQQPSAPRMEFDGPAAVISRRAADRLRAGHVWVYQSDIEKIYGEAGGLLPVADQRGILLGTALYSPASQITLRLVCSDLIDASQWLDLLRTRLQA